MKTRIFGLVVLVVMALVFSGSNRVYAASCEDEMMLSLERIKAATEAGVDYQRYSVLVSEAQLRFNLLKRESDNKPFVEWADLALHLYKYEAASAKAWRQGAGNGQLQMHWAMSARAFDLLYLLKKYGKMKELPAEVKAEQAKVSKFMNESVAKSGEESTRQIEKAKKGIPSGDGGVP